MLRFLATVFLLFLSVDLALAKAKPKPAAMEAKVACWQRIYTPAELKKHKRQKVTMALLTVETQKDGSVSATLGLNLRQRKSDWKYDYSIGGFCKPKGQTMVCTPEWDAGTFVLERGARGGLRVKNRKLVVNPFDYDSEDISPKAVDFRKSDDAIWLLFPADASACKVP